jgi:hypothetical protein
MTRVFIIFKERVIVGALAIFEDQKKEMHKAFKMLFKSGELVIEDEDFEKTEYLLHLHPTMMSVIKNYEWSQVNQENGMSQFELMNAEGNARHGEHERELNSDVTADSVVLKHKAAAIYQLYKTISNTICIVIDNLKDPHEGLIFKLLFIDGKKAGDVVKYMDRGYRSDIHPIAVTTCYEKRRKGIKKIAASLKLAGVLEVVKVDERESRIKKQVKYRMAFSQWEE